MPLRLNRLPPISQTIRETYFIFSHEFRSFNATSAKHHLNNNWRLIWAKIFAIRSWADEGGLSLFRRTPAAISPTFCLRTSLWHMSSDLPMELQSSTTWSKTDAQSGWKGSPSGVGQMRVASSRSRITPASIFPTFAVVGSSTPTYSPLLSAVQPNFDYFWILRSPASLENSLVLSSYPGLFTRNEQCFNFSWIPSQEDLLWFVARRSGVDSNAAWSNILYHHSLHVQAFVPELHFVTWVQIFQCSFSQRPREH